MDEDEEITMRLAADICRNRRSDDVRRRMLKVPSEDAVTQTETTSRDDSQAIVARFQTLTSIICYIGFALICQNISHLRLLLTVGGAHKQYSLIFGLLVMSLVLQFLFLYITRNEKARVSLRGEYQPRDRFSNSLILIITAVTLINISVFVLS